MSTYEVLGSLLKEAAFIVCSVYYAAVAGESRPLRQNLPLGQPPLNHRLDTVTTVHVLSPLE